MNGLEIEVKFFVPRPAALRRCILDTGARSEGRVFEHNTLFDDARGTLAARGRLLRLRSDNQHRLTFKAPVPDRDPQFKVLRELETRLSDAAAMREVLAALGFHPVRVYEKWRETFTLDGCHLCLDALPFGDFLEIEGERDAIRPLARRLDLRWSRRILGNYQELFEIVAEQESLDFTDITFDNFAGRRIDLAPCLGRFEAGDGPRMPERS